MAESNPNRTNQRTAWAAGIPLKIAVSALAVCASLIFQNVLFLETRSLITLYEILFAAELYASLCLLYFSLRFFAAKIRKKLRIAFALVFSPAVLYAAALIFGLPFNALSLCASVLSFCAWLASVLLVTAALSARKESLSEKPAQNPSFSKRENEVAALILQGLTTQETADALFISVATVKTHLQHIYEKTGVRNRAELARVMGGAANHISGDF